MPSVTIRPAHEGDIPALVEFNQAMAWETERKTLDRSVLTRGITAVFADRRRGCYWVAVDGDDVVGGLLITYEWSDWRNGDWWWIQSVYVRESHRRRGVFSALHAQIERSARATPGVVGLRLYVEWENQRAQHTYSALGMTQAHYHMYEQPFVTLG